MDNTNIFLWIGGVILVFLVVREVMTWYWKINQIVILLEKIEKNTRIPAKKILTDAQKEIIGND